MGFKGKLTYHFVFATKYRRKALIGLEQEVYKSVLKLANKSKFRVLELAVEDGDHLHLVLEASQTVSPEQVARRVKQRTTFDLGGSIQAISLSITGVRRSFCGVGVTTVARWGM